MDDIDAGRSQSFTLHLSPEESETAIAALCFAIKDGLKTLEYNWDADAYHGLTNSLEGAIGDINRIASRVEEGRAFLAKLSAHLDDPVTDLEPSDAEFERLGYALYAYGVLGFHGALCATRGFTNAADKSRAIDQLNQQNERAFALFKRLAQYKRNVLWMVWPQANMEHAFAPVK